MHELAVAAISAAIGAGIAAGVAAWHGWRMRKAQRAEEQAAADREARLLGNLERAGNDLRYAEGTAAGLRAERDLAREYNRGYLDGMQYGLDMTDVERMAYSLDQGKPGRLLRMSRHRQGLEGAANE